MRMNVADLRDEDDALLLLPRVAPLTAGEAEALGCEWTFTQGIPEFDAVPVSERRPEVFAVVKHWQETGFTSSYIKGSMENEISTFMHEVCHVDEDTGLTLAAEEHGRDMLKVLSYLISSGGYSKDDEKSEWLFSSLPEVLKAESVRVHGDRRMPVGLKTIGDVRRFIGVMVYVADVFDEVGYDAAPFLSVTDLSGMQILNPVISEYVANHPESAHQLAEYVLERWIGSTVEEGHHVVEWYEGIATSLKSGAL